jgi:predicted alpha/beta-fold hydrolase
LRLVRRPEVTCFASAFNANVLADCSALREEYWPPLWAYRPNACTIIQDQLRSLYYMKLSRQSLVLEDGGLATLDWADEPASPAAPILLLLHGLNGGSSAKYIRGMMRIAQDRGFWPVAINNRGHNDTELKTPVVVSGAYTEDLRYIIRHVRDLHPQRRLYAVGFSMGANILCKYLGTEGAATPLSAAVSVSNPLDFLMCENVLSQGWGLFYNLLMTVGLKRMYRRHRHLFHTHEALDDKAIMSVTRLRQFDDQFTRRLWGYQHVDDYYRDASSLRVLPGVRVPLLVLNARDDPFVDQRALPYREARENPCVTLAVTECGGHLGFLEGAFPVGSYYTRADRICAEWLNAVHKHLPPAST